MRIPSFVRLLVVLLATGWLALALDPLKALTQDAHRIWGLEEGLFQPTVYAILQTRSGFLWLGTQDSLIRFDGAHFREFEWQGRAVLHGSLVRALFEDPAGTLWVGTIGNGLARIAPDGAFSRVTGLPSENIFCLDSGPAHSLLACTDKGLLQITPGRAITVDPRPTRATCQTGDGTRWVALLDGGLVAANGLTFKADVTALACGRAQDVWAGTPGGLFRVHNGRIDHRLNAAGGLPDNAVGALSFSPDGSLWIGSDDGITRFRDGELSVYRTRDGLSHSVVLAVYVDREGTLWTGTKDGLDQFTDPKLTPYSKSEGLSSNEVGPVLQDRAGLLWIGTLDHGIDIFDGRRFRNLSAHDGLLSNRVLSLAADSDGNIWAGTGAGLNQIRDRRVIGAWDRRQAVHALALLGTSLWIATDRGVDLLSHGSIRHQSAAAVSAFVPSAPGSMPLSPAIAGFFRPVSSYVREPDGALWMGTLGAGLVRWRNGSVARVHVKDGLYDNRIYQLLRDDRSNLWVASSKGIFRLSERELNAFADGKLHTVASVPFSTGQLRFECRSGVQPAACRTRDGRLWFSTTTGLVVIDPNHLAANPVPPPARITALIIDGERVDPNGVLIHPRQKNLEIRYAGLSFVSPERVTFRYILDGYERTWTDAGARREAFYTNLPPGRFRFRVMARNADGVWGREAQALAFTVEPRFYQRRWFWPLLTVLIAGLVFLGYRRRVRRIQQTFTLLLAERSRIARELHDTLLQGIAGVTMQLQALWKQMPSGTGKQVLGGIIADAGRCAAEARQSLWHLRAPTARHATFRQRLEDVCREAVAGTPLRLLLAIDPEAAASPEIEYQLLRIAKEAVTNAARHSQAGTVSVRLGANAAALRLSIEDDGCGFSAAGDYSVFGHFGLVGMRERATEIGAELNLTSSSSGTTVSVRLPGSPKNKFTKEFAYEQPDKNPVG